MIDHASYVKEDVELIVGRLGDAAQVLSGKSMLFTGGRGFLGRHFSFVFDYLNRHVLRSPLKVIMIDNLLSSGDQGRSMPELEGIVFREHDIIEPFEPDDQRFDYIVHAASIASPFYYRAKPLETLDVGVRGTRNLLNLARSSGARFTFFSSSEIYGDPVPGAIPTQESYKGNVSCTGPRSCYDESKRLGETLCYIYHHQFGLHTNMIRPFNVYGPGMQQTDYRVMPNFGSRLKSGEALKVYGSGRQTRTFCYVADAIVGFLLVILKGVAGEPYNIGNPKPEISIVELSELIGKLLGKTVPVDLVDYPDTYPQDEPNRRSPDIRKAAMQLGYEPAISLEDGIRRFFSWTDKHYTVEP